MKLKLVLLTFLIFLALFNVAVGKLRVKGRIVSGSAAAPGQFPFYVMIKQYIHRPVEGGGSLISHDWVLTAAHVVFGVESVTMFFGVINMYDKDLLNMTSTHIFAHPGYKIGVMTNDIALIKLPESVAFNENIQPIALPTFSLTNESFVGTAVNVIGFGYTSDQYLRSFPDNLQFAEMKIIDGAQCEKALGRSIPKVIVCAEAVSAGSTCNGDSGGPAVMQDEMGDLIQIGIVSFGYDQRCELPLPVGFARISLFLEWINEATQLIEP